MKNLNLKRNSNKIVDNILGKPKRRDIKNFNIKNYPGLPPRPAYDRCNKGHGLRPVYNKTYGNWKWDCPTCIMKMAKDRGVNWNDEYKW